MNLESDEEKIRNVPQLWVSSVLQCLAMSSSLTVSSSESSPKSDLNSPIWILDRPSDQHLGATTATVSAAAAVKIGNIHQERQVVYFPPETRNGQMKYNEKIRLGQKTIFLYSLC